MILQRIKELKRTEVCDTFDWAADDLKTFNLIYGWNGSGKTTIARVFGFLERKAINIPELASVDFSIQTAAGIIRSEDIQAHGLSIRVFNQDFINDHLGFEDSKAKKIVILGKENLDMQEEIKALESKQNKEEMELEMILNEMGKLSKLDQVLTEAGGEVPKQFGNTPLANDKYYGRNYNRTKVEALINRGVATDINLQSLILSDPADLDAKRELVKSDKSKIDFSVTEAADLSKVFSSANDLLRLSVNVEHIDELDADIGLRDWVESGYHIHVKRKSASCKFCGNRLDPAVLRRLSRYFTDELKMAKASIDDKISELTKDAGSRTIELDSNKLLPDLVGDYLVARKNLEKHGTAVGNAIQALIERLKEKRNSVTDAKKKFKRIRFPQNSLERYNEAMGQINSLVATHNLRLSKINKEIDAAARSIELHTVAKILQAKNYFKQKARQEELAAKAEAVRNRIDGMKGAIREKKAAAQNASVAVDKINTVLEEFFGASQIYLEVTDPASGDLGYLLKRRGKNAKHLSEGEKSILALIYYLTKLDEEGFKKEDGVIIVDDPVDSQDAIFLFRMFSFLRRQLKDAGQVIIFTHNFEFFNLCRDWLSEKNQKVKSQLYLISTSHAGACREMRITLLPPLLKKYKSEYQYLFSRLYRYVKALEHLDEPLVPNVGRKVLEYFAAFKWSCKSTEGFTQIVLTKYGASNEGQHGIGDFVIKFANEYSHGQDFSRAVATPMFEAKEIAGQILKFIELADKEHFDTLAALCSGETC